MFAYRRKKRSKIFAISVKASRRKFAINWRVWLWLGILLLALTGLLYLAIFSPVLKIKKLAVEGVNFTAAAQAQELADDFFRAKIWKKIPRDNWLMFSSSDLSDKIMGSFPEAVSVAVDKNIFKGVKITVKGRQAAAFWCQNAAQTGNSATTTEMFFLMPQSNGCFFMDDDGLVFREAPEIFGTALPTFFSQPGQNIGPGNSAVASSTIKFAAQIKKQLRESGADLSGFTLMAGDTQSLVAFTGEGWLAYFNLSRAAQAQARVLDALLNNEIKNKGAGLKYVDLRMANKVYYK
ncbi:MAG: hypothetical protein PHT44_02445 [Candidatus Portnoybacteria bacterium]|nr:hypothetical protein [Candidatus Portnoybacteria bacterium]MDD4982400.1 hypothetical protein [Candidatus Portnoybacteria bacterium]